MSERQDFLRAAGWGDAEIAPLPGDASTRHYARLIAKGRRAMLMDQPQEAETRGRARRCRRSRSAGRWVTTPWRGWRAPIAAALPPWPNICAARGLAAPQIHAADYPHGWLVLEDLGDTLFTDVLAKGASEEELYKAAVEVLAQLHQEAAPDAACRRGIPALRL